MKLYIKCNINNEVCQSKNFIFEGENMFIDKLNLALKKRKITGAELCRKLNIPNGNYTHWKKNAPNSKTLKEIADILEVSTDWLLERDNAMDPEETKLINNYRKADDRGKRRISNLAEEEAQEQLSLTSGNGEETKINEA